MSYADVCEEIGHTVTDRATILIALFLKICVQVFSKILRHAQINQIFKGNAEKQRGSTSYEMRHSKR